MRILRLLPALLAASTALAAEPGPRTAMVCDNLRRVSPPGTMTRRPSG